MAMDVQQHKQVCKSEEKELQEKQALKVVEKNEGKYPSKYLSKSLEKSYVKLT